MKAKTLYFLFGMLLGVAITSMGAFLIFKNQKKEHIQAQIIPHKTPPPKIITKKKKPKAKRKKPNPKPSKVNMDTIPVVINDSIITNSNNNGVDANYDEDIVVVQDELLFSKEIPIPKDASILWCDKNDKLDSLLVDNYHPVNNKMIIEFWVSPLKYIGYRLNKNKLQLYGILQFDSVFVNFSHEQYLEINYLNQKLKLYCNDNLTPLNIKKEDDEVL